MVKTPGVVRIAAVGDIHLGRAAYGPPVQALFAQVAELADVLALCGDLTDRGDPEEGRQLGRALATVGVPVVAVLGNHDHESGKVPELTRILVEAGVQVLDGGDAFEVQGVGFAGVKGFAGGFGRRALGPWGEETIKAFVREAVEEALKLETSLSKLRTERKVALLHYSPIAGTVEGEPREIYAYLGSSRLEEPLIRYPVDLVFHGHAHHGTLEGKTVGGVTVYNVSLALLQRTFPEAPPFRVVELRIPQERREGGEIERRMDRQGDRRAEAQPGRRGNIILSEAKEP
ncbi:MAG TPA: metallophosphoesterase [Gemmatimonadales bacterium]|jgi:Icc-related predicted phosphoesterase|nr:metallophosphoesterase [Gemmatimonadales bacterium]